MVAANAEDPLVECLLCDGGYMQKIELRDHIAECHLQHNRHLCLGCDFKCSSSGGMARHVDDTGHKASLNGASHIHYREALLSAIYEDCIREGGAKEGAKTRMETSLDPQQTSSSSRLASSRSTSAQPLMPTQTTNSLSFTSAFHVAPTPHPPSPAVVEIIDDGEEQAQRGSGGASVPLASVSQQPTPGTGSSIPVISRRTFSIPAPMSNEEQIVITSSSSSPCAQERTNQPCEPPSKQQAGDGVGGNNASEGSKQSTLNTVLKQKRRHEPEAASSPDQCQECHKVVQAEDKWEHVAKKHCTVTLVCPLMPCCQHRVSNPYSLAVEKINKHIMMDHGGKANLSRAEKDNLNGQKQEIILDMHKYIAQCFPSATAKEEQEGAVGAEESSNGAGPKSLLERMKRIKRI